MARQVTIPLSQHLNEWIPPRLPRLSRGVFRDPEAVEVSISKATAHDAGP